MKVIRCSCGFAERDDEQVIDHLELVFVPDDDLASDGRLHHEQERLTCSCGLAAATTEELDDHFLEIFMPASLIGRDGQKHELRDAD
jgi:hypothetical protein